MDRRGGVGTVFPRRSVLGGLAGIGFGAGPAAAQMRGIKALSPTAAPAPVGRGSPSQAPVLMPGTAMHVGPVRSVAVSGDGTVIATGSADRSVRLWSAATGENLLRMHLPLGEGSVGVVDAVALSPDAKRLYASGLDWAAPAGASQGMVYVFDLTSGKLDGLMAWPPGFGSRLRHLALSPSGQQVAIAAGNNGLVVRDTAGPSFALRYAEPAQMTVSTSAAAYSPDGALLATAASNGRLRLLAVQPDGGVREVSARSLPGGGQPNSLAFSPDGASIAVGYLDRPQVLVVPMRGGAPLVLTPPARTSQGNLGAVAWGQGEDGRTWLFGAGTVVDGAGANLMIGWRDGLPGGAVALPVTRDSVTQMVTHPGGGVVFGSSDPRWGWISPARDGKSLRSIQTLDTERLDFRGVAARAWGIDPTGSIIEFRGAGAANTVMRFDLTELTLSRGGTRRTDMARPRAVVNGQAPAGVAVPRGALVRSADAVAELGRTLIGTDDYLVMADFSGRELARRDIATAAWGVAVARSRPVAVAAHGDGTVRWYALDRDRMLTELGGLFVAADEQRWVAWRADGRFAHSAGGGAKLVGFQQNGQFEPGHVTDGGMTGRWLDIDQMYRRLYDPDSTRLMLVRDGGDKAPEAAANAIETLELPVIQVRALCATDERSLDSRGIRVVAALNGAPEETAAPAVAPIDGAACRSFDTGAPKRDEAITLPAGTTAMRVRLGLDGHGNTTQVAAFVNEQNVGRALVRAEGGRGAGTVPVEQHVPLFPGENRVEFRAYVPGKQDFTRAPTILRVTVAAAGQAAPVVTRPVLRALVVGVDDYQGSIHKLRFARADAQTFAAAIGRRVAREYSQPAVETLLDREATLDAVTAKLAAIAQAAQPADAVVIYFAGHGVVGTDDKSYAFMTADVADADAALRGGQGMGADRLARVLAEVRAERVFVFLDTCYAGAFDPRTIGYLNHDTGRYVLAASTRLEEALDGYDGRNGVFAHAVKEGLEGRAAAQGRSIDAFDVGRYVSTRVEELAQERSWQQRAVFQASGRITAFPLVAPLS